MSTSPRTIRFGIRQMLLMLLLIGILLAAVSPPHVEFLNSSVQQVASLDGTVSHKFSMEVRNSGFLPIWFRNEPHDTLALGATKNIDLGTIRESDAQWAPWTKLLAGDSIWIEEYSHGERCVAGIPIRDWLGRKHIFFNFELDYTE